MRSRFLLLDQGKSFYQRFAGPPSMVRMLKKWAVGGDIPIPTSPSPSSSSSVAVVGSSTYPLSTEPFSSAALAHRAAVGGFLSELLAQPSAQEQQQLLLAEGAEGEPADGSNAFAGAPRLPLSVGAQPAGICVFRKSTIRRLYSLSGGDDAGTAIGQGGASLPDQQQEQQLRADRSGRSPSFSSSAFSLVTLASTSKGSLEQTMRSVLPPPLFSAVQPAKWRWAQERVNAIILQVEQCVATYGEDAVFPWD